MRQRLKGLLALLDTHNVEQLIHRFLQIHHHKQYFDALLIGLLDDDRQVLNCYTVMPGSKQPTLELNANIDDVNHPFIQVLRQGIPACWPTLNRGARIENAQLHDFMQSLPHECGLYAKPLFDHRGYACGVAVVLAKKINRFSDRDGMFNIYLHVLQNRLNKLQEVVQLQDQLKQIRDVFAAQQQRQKQLDELLVSLSTTDRPADSGLGQDYSKIDDLVGAVEEFECAVLAQRQRMYGSNRKLIAESLRLAPRALSYKLAKYGCLS